jgi:hypothetical protein
LCARKRGQTSTAATNGPAACCNAIALLARPGRRQTWRSLGMAICCCCCRRLCCALLVVVETRALNIQHSTACRSQPRPARRMQVSRKTSAARSGSDNESRFAPDHRRAHGSGAARRRRAIAVVFALARGASLLHRRGLWTGAAAAVGAHQSPGPVLRPRRGGALAAAEEAGRLFHFRFGPYRLIVGVGWADAW